MSNWLPIVTLNSAILLAIVASSNALQCSELANPTWRVFDDLNQFKASNKSFNVIVNANSNWARIKNIYSQHLQYKEFDAVDAGFLVRLDLSGLNLKTLVNGSFQNLYCLEILDLQNNGFTVFPIDGFAGLTHLKVLNLSRNYINHLDKDTFGFMKVLHTLDLSLNVLHSVGDKAFMELPNLQFLNVSFNLLQNIDFMSWELSTSLISLNASHNNLVIVVLEKRKKYSHFTRFDLSFNDLEYFDVPSLKAMAPNMALFFIHGNKFHCAFLERMVEDFARFHFFYRTANQTFYNVDGIDCIGRFDEDLTQFDLEHKKDIEGPAIHFPASAIPHHENSSMMSFANEKFLTTIKENNMKLIDAIHSLRTMIVLLFVFVLVFVVVNVLIKTGFTQRFFSLMRLNRRGEQHEPIDSSMEIENFRLIPSVQNVRV